MTDKPSFNRVFKKPRRSRDKLFTVLYRENRSGDARLGLAIAKKNCRLATARNRLKRIIRESFREQRAHLPGVDIVVLNQPAATRASNQAVFASLATHWQQMRAATSDHNGPGKPAPSRQGQERN